MTQPTAPQNNSTHELTPATGAGRVWASIKYTVNLGNYQNATYDMGVSVDPSLPIQPQLEQAREPLKATADFIESMLLAQMQQNEILTALRQRQPAVRG